MTRFEKVKYILKADLQLVKNHTEKSFYTVNNKNASLFTYLVWQTKTLWAFK